MSTNRTQSQPLPTQQHQHQSNATNSKSLAKSHCHSHEECDVIGELMGKYGKYQFYMTFLLSLFQVPNTFHISSTIYQVRTRFYTGIRTRIEKKKRKSTTHSPVTTEFSTLSTLLWLKVAFSPSLSFDSCIYFSRISIAVGFLLTADSFTMFTALDLLLFIRAPDLKRP